MNPFGDKSEEKNTFFGKHFIEGWLNPRKKQKPWTYSRMKLKQIAKRRARRKMARKSNQINYRKKKGK